MKDTERCFPVSKYFRVFLVEFECIELGQLLFSCFSWNGLHKINCEYINCFKHLLIIFCQQFLVTQLFTFVAEDTPL